MRFLGAVIAATIVVALLALGASADDPATDRSCRQQWVDLIQLHGENGNPEGPVAELNQRWEQLDAQASAYAEDSDAAVCGATIDDFADAWADLEGFQYELHAFDPAGDRRRAEQDRRHYLGLGNHLSRELRAAFRTIRKHTPGAVRDLRPALAGAVGVDLRDPAAVRAFVEQVRREKRDSRHVRRMRPAYRVIGNAELHEE